MAAAGRYLDYVNRKIRKKLLITAKGLDVSIFRIKLVVEVKGFYNISAGHGRFQLYSCNSLDALKEIGLK